MTNSLLPAIPEGLKVLRNAHGYNHYFTHLQMEAYGQACFDEGRNERTQINITPWRERADCDWQAEIDELRAALKTKPTFVQTRAQLEKEWCELNAMRAALKSQTVCEYDETTGNCTKNPCCRTAPVQPATTFQDGWNACMKEWADHMKRMNDAIQKGQI